METASSGVRLAPEGPGPAWHTDWAAWTLLLLAWAFFFSGLFQLFPVPGWVDAGTYQGYGLQLPTLVKRYGFTTVSYHGSRLTYVLILYLCHRLASPEIGQYLQLLFFHGMAILSLLAVGYRHFGRSPALLGAAFLAFNPLFFSALTFGGADGAALSYLLLTLAVLFSRSGVAGSQRTLVAAGMTCACACIANPFAIIPLLGLLAACHISAVQRSSSLDRYVALSVGGALALVILGLIARALGLEFFFLKYSFGMTRLLAGGFGAAYLRPLDEWLFVNYRMLVPMVLGLSALALLGVRPELRRDRLFQSAALVAPLLPFVVQLCINLSGQAVLLQSRHHFTLLLPGLAFSVLALARAATPARPMLGPAVLLSLPAAAVGLGLSSPAWVGSNARVVFWSLLGLGGFLALMLVTSGRRAGSRSLIMSAVIMLCAVCFSLSEDSQQVYRVTTGDDYREAFLGASHLVRVLEESGLAERKPWFWFPRRAENERSGLGSTFRLDYQGGVTHQNYFDTLVSYYLWKVSLLGASFRSLQTRRLDEAGARPIVFLAPRASLCQRALSRVEALGYRVSNRRWFEYPRKRFGWAAVAVDVSRVEPAGLRSGPEPVEK